MALAETMIHVDPGICGFDCRIQAALSGKRTAKVTLIGSDCTMIQALSKSLHDISLQALFVPITKNLIFMAAEKAGCHLACPVPVAIVKACEAALGLAVKKDAALRFLNNNS